MNAPNDIPHEAAIWHQRLQSDAADEQVWLEFERWMASPQNRAAYEQLEANMRAIDADPAAVSRKLSPAPPSVTLPRVPMPVWVTAAFAVAAVCIFMVVPRQPAEAIYSAPATETRSVTLADNSVLTLNRGASVRVRFDPDARHVILERGEAAFDVRHDEARPFAVTADATNIEDIGTEFNVTRGPQAVVVAVREGKVAISPVGRERIELAAGQAARVDQKTGATEVVAANAEDAFGWQSGRLIYHDASLAAIVEDLNRYSAKPIILADAHAASLHFTGALVIDDPMLMLRRLEAFLPIQSAQNGDTIVLRSRP